MQTPRGWGLFLIQKMVDEVLVSGSPDHHTIELVMHLEEGEDARSRQSEAERASVARNNGFNSLPSGPQILS
jgi:hypothetical protein